ncbi:MAG TPA: PH domain-containing protein [Acidimicrobiales bacterium]|nr:PH domain-containing protein [Acidimicrobiales bacterium]
MAFSRRLLNPGEELVLEERPHWLFVAGPLATLGVVVAGALALVVVASPPNWAQVALVVVIGACLARLASRYLRWRSTTLAVTSHRVVFTSGVLARRTREIPLERVNDCSVHQSLLERLVGAGRLLVESGGEAGQDCLPRMPRPARVLNAIHRQIGAGARTGATVESIPDQILKLDELCRRGVISEQEFAAKKAELLRRM